VQPFQFESFPFLGGEIGSVRSMDLPPSVPSPDDSPFSLPCSLRSSLFRCHPPPPPSHECNAVEPRNRKSFSGLAFSPLDFARLKRLNVPSLPPPNGRSPRVLAQWTHFLVFSLFPFHPLFVLLSPRGNGPLAMPLLPLPVIPRAVPTLTVRATNAPRKLGDHFQPLCFPLISRCGHFF